MKFITLIITIAALTVAAPTPEESYPSVDGAVVVPDGPISEAGDSGVTIAAPGATKLTCPVGETCIGGSCYFGYCYGGGNQHTCTYALTKGKCTDG